MPDGTGPHDQDGFTVLAGQLHGAKKTIARSLPFRHQFEIDQGQQRPVDIRIDIHRAQDQRLADAGIAREDIGGLDQ